MKKFVNKLLILTLIAGSITSCWPESGIGVTWNFENKSGNDIIIINNDLNHKSISIPNGKTYLESWGGIGGGFPGPFDNTSNIDIIFNNEKILNYNDKNRDMFNSPFNMSNYREVIVVQKKRNQEYEYYYTFVPEQYDMAEPYMPEK